MMISLNVSIIAIIHNDKICFLRGLALCSAFSFHSHFLLGVNLIFLFFSGDLFIILSLIFHVVAKRGEFCFLVFGEVDAFKGPGTFIVVFVDAFLLFAVCFFTFCQKGSARFLLYRLWNLSESCFERMPQLRMQG